VKPLTPPRVVAPSFVAMANEDASPGRSVKFKLDATAVHKDASENVVDDISSSSYADEAEQSTSANTNDLTDENNKSIQKRKRQDDTRVRRLRYIVLSLLVVTGIVISIVAYITIREQETLDYTRSVSAPGVSLLLLLSNRRISLCPSSCSLKRRPCRYPMSSVHDPLSWTMNYQG
jgi:hypothetical protein